MNIQDFCLKHLRVKNPLKYKNQLWLLALHSSRLHVIILVLPRSLALIIRHKNFSPLRQVAKVKRENFLYVK